MTGGPRLLCIVPNPSIDKTAEVDRLEAGTIHRPGRVVSVVALSGSLPPGSVFEDVGRFIAAARRAGCRAVVDTGGSALREALAASPDLVKVNASEAAAVTGIDVNSPTSGIAAGRRLVEMGASWAIVTLGRIGAVGCDG